MRRPILNKWWPVTYDFGFIHAPVETVLDTRLKVYVDHGTKDCSLRDLNQSLETCFRALEPLSFQNTKEMYLSTNFGWTAFFRNGTRGSDPALPMRQLSKALGVCAMRICISPASSTFPSVIWEVYDTQKNGANAYGYRRSIACANDGGRWVFEARGDPFPFEELDRYTARKIRDRFPEALLWKYLRKLDIPHISDNDFLFGEVCNGGIIDRPKIEGALHLSLSEAIAAY